MNEPPPLERTLPPAASAPLDLGAVDDRLRPLAELVHLLLVRPSTHFGTTGATWDEYAIDPLEFIDAGPSVVVVVHNTAVEREAASP